KLGEASRLGRKRRRERAAATHFVANVTEDASGAGTAGVVHDEPQGAVEVLPCRQHDGKFTCHLTEGRLVETPGAAEFELQQFAQASAPIGRIGAQYEVALTLQPLDDGSPIGRLHHASHGIPPTIDRRPAKRGHVSVSNGVSSQYAKPKSSRPPQRCARFPAQAPARL